MSKSEYRRLVIQAPEKVYARIKELEEQLKTREAEPIHCKSCTCEMNAYMQEMEDAATRALVDCGAGDNSYLTQEVMEIIANRIAANHKHLFAFRSMDKKLIKRVYEEAMKLGKDFLHPGKANKRSKNGRRKAATD